MSRANVPDHIPRYGWDARTLYDDVEISSAALSTDAVRRPAGLFQASVKATVDDSSVSSTGTYNIILEGSNYGDDLNPDEWFEIASLPSDDLFAAPQSVTAGFVSKTLANGATVNIGRFQYLRVRAEIVSGTPAFTATIKMTGTSGDGERFARSIPVVKASGDPVEFSTDYVSRPAGTRWLTATGKVTSIILDPGGAQGVSIILEGAADQSSADAGDFTVISTGNLNNAQLFMTAVDETCIFAFEGQPSIDMGSFNFFRIRTENSTGTPMSTLSSFTISVILSFDDNDWQQGETGFESMSQAVRQLFVYCRFDAPQAQVGNTVTIDGQFVDVNGVPVLAPIQATVVISNLTRAANFSLHPTWDFISSQALQVGLLPANTAPIQAASNGQFSITVDSNGNAGTGYVTCTNFVPLELAGNRLQATLVGTDQATVVIT